LSKSDSPRLRKLLDGARHAFSMQGPHGPLADSDRELLGRLAKFVVRRRLASAAILLLESLRPLNYVGSQAMLFLRPFAATLFREGEYEKLAAILERREGLHALIEAIEAMQAAADSQAGKEAKP